MPQNPLVALGDHLSVFSRLESAFISANPQSKCFTFLGFFRG
jgi:hypothetical protein